MQFPISSSTGAQSGAHLQPRQSPLLFWIENRCSQRPCVFRILLAIVAAWGGLKVCSKSPRSPFRSFGRLTENRRLNIPPMLKVISVGIHLSGLPTIRQLELLEGSLLFESLLRQCGPVDDGHAFARIRWGGTALCLPLGFPRGALWNTERLNGFDIVVRPTRFPPTPKVKWLPTGGQWEPEPVCCLWALRVVTPFHKASGWTLAQLAKTPQLIKSFPMRSRQG